MKLNKFILICYTFNIITCSKSEQKIEECPDGTKCSKDNGKCTKYSDNDALYFCDCNPGYITYPYDSEFQCNYQQKSQLKAFLLELFLCYGSGHFYIHNYKLAVPKLVVFAFFYCLFIALRIITKAKEENKLANLIICISAGVTFVGMLVWQIIDLVNFGRNNYNDGNDVPLKGWKN